MITSERGRALIKSFESCRLTAYKDSGGITTIGWGTTGPDIHMGMTVTQEWADERFNSDLGRFERDVESLVTVPLTQGQFDALVSFSYNCGSDIDEDKRAEGLGDSTLLRLLNKGDYDGAGNEFQKWVKDGGKTIRGLVRRRAAETELFRST